MAKKEYSEFESIHQAPGVSFARKAILIWLPLLYLLISDSFYLRTYDSAQVKITLLQMGGLSLFGLWLSLLVLEGRKAFRKDDFILLAPFFAYFLYIIISFLHVPYKGPSTDDFVRYFLYMSVAFIIVREFNLKTIDNLTRILVLTAAISVGYGIIQFLDTRFFPPKGVGPGIDPFIWRQAFSMRVFSTYGNPNFFGNFLVLIMPILVVQLLKKKSLHLIPLIIANFICLYATETKGAWLGFGISAFIFAVLYGYFFIRERMKIGKATYILIASSFPVMAFIAVGIYVYKRPTSVSFRVATWLSTWEIIETHPFIGSGVGVFKVLYPAYRRPIIFHIEGKHNTETDHAEDEWLEQWMDNGVIGFGIFLWIISFVTFVALRALEMLTSNLKGARPPPVAYDLLGYLTAYLGMLIHNTVDVSLRFVSSGIFLGLLPAVVINLSRGNALWELHYKESEIIPSGKISPEKGEIYNWFLRILKVVCACAVVYFVFVLFSQFSQLQGPMNRARQGDSLQWIIAWSTMLACGLGVGYAFIRVIFEGKSPVVPLILVLFLFPIYFFWGWFKADVYHNMAIFFSKQNKWDDAITYYEKVHKHNPFFIMPYYFMGNVFNDRFDMEKKYKPQWGDKNDTPRTDYERAMAKYEKVRSMAPNYVQMHHQVGVLYLKMAEYYNKKGNAKKREEFLDKALARFNLYHNLDPVFEYNYYRKAQIYIFRKQYKKAEEEYMHYIMAPECHRPGHKHENARVYYNLGNLHYIMGKYKDALADYEIALRFDPNYKPAIQNRLALKRKLKL